VDAMIAAWNTAKPNMAKSRIKRQPCRSWLTDTATPAVLADFARGARAGSSTTQVEEISPEEE
jgi:hypothetical protein